jgi:hypothetical protein
MITNLNNYKKLRSAKNYIIELTKIKNALIKSSNCLIQFCEKNEDVNKLNNEILTNVETYNALIETYKKHIARMERNDI